METLPQLLRKNAEDYGKRTAMREKYRGIWKEYSWSEYLENVKYFCLGLLRLGMKKGDKVSILGENKPEWYWAELAVQSARGGCGWRVYRLSSRRSSLFCITF